jgi:phosphate:Na+ symporter
MTEIFLSITAGLVLFLFAVTNLSETLKSALSENANVWIKKYTSNSFSSLLVGILVTTLLDSSSAVIIITIVLVNSQILTFRQAMGIVLGANIGKTEKLSNIGKTILFFGVLFFGLFTMENAVEPLKDEAFFTEWMKKTENPLIGSIVGAIVTLIIQSSSATVGMAIILSKKGLISLTGGIAVMLGAELGTCSDTLLATIKGSRQALKTGLFHVTFNLLSILLGLTLFYPFVELVKIISSGASIERTIANAHMIFNIAGVLIFIWTIPFFEKILNKLLPDKSIT